MGIFEIIQAGITIIASAAVKVASVINKIGMTIDKIRGVADAIVDTCKFLGFIDNNESPEDLGDKGIQAEESGLKPEDYNSYGEWVSEVEKFEVDPEKSMAISENDKNCKAIELSSGLLIEKYPGIELTPVLADVANISSEKASAILDVLKNEGIEKYNNIVGVITNKETDPERFSDGVASLVEIEKKLDPTLTDQEALKKAIQSIGEIKGE